MNEQEFRTSLRNALGDPPPSDLRKRVEARLTAGPSRHRSSVLGPVAATLALVAIAGAVGWRLVYQRTNATSTVKQSMVATPIVPTAAAVDPLNCRLPVVIMRESGPPGQLVTEPGFVDTRSGQYVKDNAASIAGLPGGAFEGTDVKPYRAPAPAWYDEVVRRWLPVGNTLVAPDGRSYIWTRLLPQGSNVSNFKSAELHRYDLTTASDHLLWSYAGYINVHQWDASGIFLDTDPPPPAGGTVIYWLIDPQTGVATQQPPASRGSIGPTKPSARMRRGGLFTALAAGRPATRNGSFTNPRLASASRSTRASRVTQPASIRWVRWETVTASGSATTRRADSGTGIRLLDCTRSR